jgi:hypothetical protein
MAGDSVVVKTRKFMKNPLLSRRQVRERFAQVGVFVGMRSDGGWLCLNEILTSVSPLSILCR